ncbi:MAG: hypothetical protein M3340_11665 [Actinomycetota bacterium]|nr:hypothetical protein [Actinomycetota bacterium]
MSILSDIHSEDWRDRADPDGAVAAARRLYEAVESGEIDPVQAIDQLEIAAEPLWDHEDGDPDLVLRVVRDMQPAFVRATDYGDLKDPERIEMRVRPTILLARAQHRVSGEEREAFLTGLSVLTFLESFVSGHEALLDVIGRPTRNAVAEAAVALMGIFPAALRRAQIPPTVREQYRRLGVRLVQAYVGETGPKAVYPRTAALASQWFYLLVNDRRAGEEPLVHALYALDLQTRPQDARGQVTRGQRDAAFAKYCDDTAGFERNRDDALQDLEDFGLTRHLEVIKRYGYLSA